MVNLLIISSSSKAKSIQDFLQPQLKAKIDVLADFDHGLKDVFEKRPAIVIIQDQIASVTGESVARHIQLLLGSDTPKFIVMHEGNARVKPIKGLFEHVVDLNQDETGLIATMVGALKGILGPGWDKVAIPLQAPATPPVAAIPAAVIGVPEEKRDAAERLVDDFLSDLGGSKLPSPGNDPAGPVDESRKKESASTDELASMLLDAVHESRIRQADPDGLPSMRQTAQPDKAIQRGERGAAADASAEPFQPPSVAKAPPAMEIVSINESLDFPELEQSPSLTRTGVPGTIPAAPQPDPDAAAEQKSPAKSPARPTRPADFRIAAATEADRAVHAEEIPTAFDENYRSRPRGWLVLAVVAPALLIAGWYLLNQGSHLLPFLKKPQQPAAAVAPKIPQTGIAKQPEPISPDTNPLSKKGAPVVAPAPPLPSFVQAAGRDVSFSAAKPGWERYVDKAREVRIFRAGGRIKAIQVMAVKGQLIQDSFLRAVLKEVAGSGEYSSGTREKKSGYLIRRSRVGRKGDLLVYYGDQPELIRAFVVSLD